MLAAVTLALVLSQSPQPEGSPRVIEVQMPPSTGEPATAPPPVGVLPEPDAGSPPPAESRAVPLPPPALFFAPDAGAAPIGHFPGQVEPQPLPSEQTGIHVRAALELDFTSEPSGPPDGTNDLLFGIRPVFQLDTGEWFEAELGAYFRLRMTDDGRDNWPNDIGGALRGGDWDQPSDFGQIIRHVRVAKESGPFFATLGAVTRRTLGLGHLINRYSNQENPDYHPASATAVLTLGPTRTEAFVSDIFGARLFAGEFTFDFGRLATNDPLQHDRYLLALSFAYDAGLAGYTAPSAALVHSDFSAVIYRSDAARILLEAGGGARFDVRSDFGFVAGIAIDADLGTLQTGGKLEVRKQYGGFRHGFFGPTYEISRFASMGFKGTPLALEQLPDNWSLYGELRLASGKIVSTDAAVEHFFYGRTDLDFSLALNVFDGRIAATSHLSIVGIGLLPRFATRTEVRVRVLSFLYLLVQAGIQLSPQPDWSLGRGVYFGVGAGADFSR